MPPESATDSTDSPQGLLIVCQSPAELRVGGPWVMIAQWADAGADLFGRSWISTPNEVLGASEAREFATLTSRGKATARGWRGRIPEPAVTLVKDLRTARRAAATATEYGAVPDGVSTPFVLQHHGLFQRRGRTVADRLGVPLVVGVDSLQVREATSWGVRRPGWAGALERVGERRPLRDADLLTTVSSETAASLAELFGADKVVVTENRVDLARYRNLDRDAGRMALGCRDDEFVVGWVGSFRSFHGLDVVFEAFERLARSVPSAVLVLVGDGPERDRYEEWSRRLTHGRVVFTGMLPFAEVPERLAAFDVAVIGSRAGESFHYSPLKLQEYLAAGVPVVGPALGQVATTLAGDSAGRLYPAGDATVLADRLEELAGSAPTRDAMSAAAVDLAERLGTPAGELAKVCERLGVAVPTRA